MKFYWDLKEVSEKERVCMNCKYYYLHYTSVDGVFFRPCNAGHCIHPRSKYRKPEDTCKNFIEKEI